MQDAPLFRTTAKQSLIPGLENSYEAQARPFDTFAGVSRISPVSREESVKRAVAPDVDVATPSAYNILGQVISRDYLSASRAGRRLIAYEDKIASGRTRTFADAVKERFTDNAMTLVPFLSTAVSIGNDIFEATRSRDVFDKLARGEEVTVDELITVKSMLSKAEWESSGGFGALAADIIMPMASFAAEFGIESYAFNLAAKGLSKVFKPVARHLSMSAASRSAASNAVSHMSNGLRTLRNLDSGVRTTGRAEAVKSISNVIRKYGPESAVQSMTKNADAYLKTLYTASGVTAEGERLIRHVAVEAAKREATKGALAEGADQAAKLFGLLARNKADDAIAYVSRLRSSAANQAARDALAGLTDDFIKDVSGNALKLSANGSKISEAITSSATIGRVTGNQFTLNTISNYVNNLVSLNYGLGRVGWGRSFIGNLARGASDHLMAGMFTWGADVASLTADSTAAAVKNALGQLFIQIPVKGAMMTTFGETVRGIISYPFTDDFSLMSQSELSYRLAALQSGDTELMDSAFWYGIGSSMMEYASETAGPLFGQIGKALGHSRLFKPAFTRLSAMHESLSAARGFAAASRDSGVSIRQAIESFTGSGTTLANQATVLRLQQNAIEALARNKSAWTRAFNGASETVESVLSDTAKRKVALDAAKKLMTGKAIRLAFMQDKLMQLSSVPGLKNLLSPTSVARMFRGVGYDGLLEEWLEERFNGFVSGLLGLDPEILLTGDRTATEVVSDALGGFFPDSLDLAFAEIVAFSIPGAVSASIYRTQASLANGSISSAVESVNKFMEAVNTGASLTVSGMTEAQRKEVIERAQGQANGERRTVETQSGDIMTPLNEVGEKFHGVNTQEQISRSQVEEVTENLLDTVRAYVNMTRDERYNIRLGYTARLAHKFLGAISFFATGSFDAFKYDPVGSLTAASFGGAPIVRMLGSTWNRVYAKSLGKQFRGIVNAISGAVENAADEAREGLPTPDEIIDIAKGLDSAKRYDTELAPVLEAARNEILEKDSTTSDEDLALGMLNALFTVSVDAGNTFSSIVQRAQSKRFTEKAAEEVAVTTHEFEFNNARKAAEAEADQAVRKSISRFFTAAGLVNVSFSGELREAAEIDAKRIFDSASVDSNLANGIPATVSYNVYGSTDGTAQVGRVTERVTPENRDEVFNRLASSIQADLAARFVELSSNGQISFRRLDQYNYGSRMSNVVFTVSHSASGSGATVYRAHIDALVADILSARGAEVTTTVDSIGDNAGLMSDDRGLEVSSDALRMAASVEDVDSLLEKTDEELMADPAFTAITQVVRSLGAVYGGSPSALRSHIKEVVRLSKILATALPQKGKDTDKLWYRRVGGEVDVVDFTEESTENGPVITATFKPRRAEDGASVSIRFREDEKGNLVAIDGKTPSHTLSSILVDEGFVNSDTKVVFTPFSKVLFHDPLVAIASSPAAFAEFMRRVDEHVKANPDTPVAAISSLFNEPGSDKKSLRALFTSQDRIDAVRKIHRDRAADVSTGLTERTEYSSIPDASDPTAFAGPTITVDAEQADSISAALSIIEGVARKVLDESFIRGYDAASGASSWAMPVASASSVDRVVVAFDPMMFSDPSAAVVFSVVHNRLMSHVDESFGGSLSEASVSAYKLNDVLTSVVSVAREYADELTGKATAEISSSTTQHIANGTLAHDLRYIADTIEKEQASYSVLASLMTHGLFGYGEKAAFTGNSVSLQYAYGPLVSRFADRDPLHYALLVAFTMRTVTRTQGVSDSEAFVKAVSSLGAKGGVVGSDVITRVSKAMESVNTSDSTLSDKINAVIGAISSEREAADKTREQLQRVKDAAQAAKDAADKEAAAKQAALNSVNESIDELNKALEEAKAKVSSAKATSEERKVAADEANRVTEELKQEVARQKAAQADVKSANEAANKAGEEAAKASENLSSHVTGQARDQIDDELRSALSSLFDGPDLPDILLFADNLSFVVKGSERAKDAIGRLRAALKKKVRSSVKAEGVPTSPTAVVTNVETRREEVATPKATLAPAPASPRVARDMTNVHMHASFSSLDPKALYQLSKTVQRLVPDSLLRNETGYVKSDGDILLELMGYDYAFVGVAFTVEDIALARAIAEVDRLRTDDIRDQEVRGLVLVGLQDLLSLTPASAAESILRSIATRITSADYASSRRQVIKGLRDLVLSGDVFDMESAAGLSAWDSVSDSTSVADADANDDVVAEDSDDGPDNAQYVDLFELEVAPEWGLIRAMLRALFPESTGNVAKAVAYFAAETAHSLSTIDEKDVPMLAAMRDLLIRDGASFTQSPLFWSDPEASESPAASLFRELRDRPGASPYVMVFAAMLASLPRQRYNLTIGTLSQAVPVSGVGARNVGRKRLFTDRIGRLTQANNDMLMTATAELTDLVSRKGLSGVLDEARALSGEIRAIRSGVFVEKAVTPELKKERAKALRMLSRFFARNKARILSSAVSRAADLVEGLVTTVGPDGVQVMQTPATLSPFVPAKASDSSLFWGDVATSVLKFIGDISRVVNDNPAEISANAIRLYRSSPATDIAVAAVDDWTEVSATAPTSALGTMLNALAGLSRTPTATDEYGSSTPLYRISLSPTQREFVKDIVGLYVGNATGLQKELMSRFASWGNGEEMFTHVVGGSYAAEAIVRDMIVGLSAKRPASSGPSFDFVHFPVYVGDRTTLATFRVPLAVYQNMASRVAETEGKSVSDISARDMYSKVFRYLAQAMGYASIEPKRVQVTSTEQLQVKIGGAKPTRVLVSVLLPRDESGKVSSDRIPNETFAGAGYISFPEGTPNSLNALVGFPGSSNSKVHILSTKQDKKNALGLQYQTGFLLKGNFVVVSDKTVRYTGGSTEGAISASVNRIANRYGQTVVATDGDGPKAGVLSVKGNTLVVYKGDGDNRTIESERTGGKLMDLIRGFMQERMSGKVIASSGSSWDGVQSALTERAFIREKDGTERKLTDVLPGFSADVLDPVSGYVSFSYEDPDVVASMAANISHESHPDLSNAASNHSHDVLSLLTYHGGSASPEALSATECANALSEYSVIRNRINSSPYNISVMTRSSIDDDLSNSMPDAAEDMRASMMSVSRKGAAFQTPRVKAVLVSPHAKITVGTDGNPVVSEDGRTVSDRYFTADEGVNGLGHRTLGRAKINVSDGRFRYMTFVRATDAEDLFAKVISAIDSDDPGAVSTAGVQEARVRIEEAYYGVENAVRLSASADKDEVSKAIENGKRTRLTRLIRALLVELSSFDGVGKTKARSKVYRSVLSVFSDWSGNRIDPDIYATVLWGDSATDPSIEDPIEVFSKSREELRGVNIPGISDPSEICASVGGSVFTFPRSPSGNFGPVFTSLRASVPYTTRLVSFTKGSGSSAVVSEYLAPGLDSFVCPSPTAMWRLGADCDGDTALITLPIGRMYRPGYGFVDWTGRLDSAFAGAVPEHVELVKGVLSLAGKLSDILLSSRGLVVGFDKDGNPVTTNGGGVLAEGRSDIGYVMDSSILSALIPSILDETAVHEFETVLGDLTNITVGQILSLSSDGVLGLSKDVLSAASSLYADAFSSIAVRREELTSTTRGTFVGPIEADIIDSARPVAADKASTDLTDVFAMTRVMSSAGNASVARGAGVANMRSLQTAYSNHLIPITAAKFILQRTGKSPTLSLSKFSEFVRIGDGASNALFDDLKEQIADRLRIAPDTADVFYGLMYIRALLNSGNGGSGRSFYAARVSDYLDMFDMRSSDGSRIPFSGPLGVAWAFARDDLSSADERKAWASRLFPADTESDADSRKAFVSFADAVMDIRSGNPISFLVDSVSTIVYDEANSGRGKNRPRPALDIKGLAYSFFRTMSSLPFTDGIGRGVVTEELRNLWSGDIKAVASTMRNPFLRASLLLGFLSYLYGQRYNGSPIESMTVEQTRVIVRTLESLNKKGASVPKIMASSSEVVLAATTMLYAKTLDSMINGFASRPKPGSGIERAINAGPQLKEDKETNGQPFVVVHDEETGVETYLAQVDGSADIREGEAGSNMWSSLTERGKVAESRLSVRTAFDTGSPSVKVGSYLDSLAGIANRYIKDDPVLSTTIPREVLVDDRTALSTPESGKTKTPAVASTEQEDIVELEELEDGLSDEGYSVFSGGVSRSRTRRISDAVSMNVASAAWLTLFRREFSVGQSDATANPADGVIKTLCLIGEGLVGSTVESGRTGRKRPGDGIMSSSATVTGSDKAASVDMNPDYLLLAMEGLMLGLGNSLTDIISSKDLYDIGEDGGASLDAVSSLLSLVQFLRPHPVNGKYIEGESRMRFTQVFPSTSPATAARLSWALSYALSGKLDEDLNTNPAVKARLFPEAKAFWEDVVRSSSAVARKTMKLPVSANAKDMSAIAGKAAASFSGSGSMNGMTARMFTHLVMLYSLMTSRTKVSSDVGSRSFAELLSGDAKEAFLQEFKRLIGSVSETASEVYNRAAQVIEAVDADEKPEEGPTYGNDLDPYSRSLLTSILSGVVGKGYNRIGYRNGRVYSSTPIVPFVTTAVGKGLRPDLGVDVVGPAFSGPSYRSIRASYKGAGRAAEIMQTAEPEQTKEDRPTVTEPRTAKVFDVTFDTESTDSIDPAVFDQPKEETPRAKVFDVTFDTESTDSIDPAVFDQPKEETPRAKVFDVTFDTESTDSIDPAGLDQSSEAATTVDMPKTVASSFISTPASVRKAKGFSVRYVKDGSSDPVMFGPTGTLFSFGRIEVPSASRTEKAGLSGIPVVLITEPISQAGAIDPNHMVTVSKSLIAVDSYDMAAALAAVAYESDELMPSASAGFDPGKIVGTRVRPTIINGKPYVEVTSSPETYGLVLSTVYAIMAAEGLPGKILPKKEQEETRAIIVREYLNRFPGAKSAVTSLRKKTGGTVAKAGLTAPNTNAAQEISQYLTDLVVAISDSNGYYTTGHFFDETGGNWYNTLTASTSRTTGLLSHDQLNEKKGQDILRLTSSLIAARRMKGSDLDGLRAKLEEKLFSGYTGENSRYKEAYRENETLIIRKATDAYIDAYDKALAGKTATPRAKASADSKARSAMYAVLRGFEGELSYTPVKESRIRYSLRHVQGLIDAARRGGIDEVNRFVESSFFIPTINDVVMAVSDLHLAVDQTRKLSSSGEDVGAAIVDGSPLALDRGQYMETISDAVAEFRTSLLGDDVQAGSDRSVLDAVNRTAEGLGFGGNVTENEERLNTFLTTVAHLSYLSRFMRQNTYAFYLAQDIIGKSSIDSLSEKVRGRVLNFVSNYHKVFPSANDVYAMMAAFATGDPSFYAHRVSDNVSKSIGEASEIANACAGKKALSARLAGSMASAIAEVFPKVALSPTAVESSVRRTEETLRDKGRRESAVNLLKANGLRLVLDAISGNGAQGVSSGILYGSVVDAIKSFSVVAGSSGETAVDHNQLTLMIVLNSAFAEELPDTVGEFVAVAGSEDVNAEVDRLMRDVAVLPEFTSLAGGGAGRVKPSAPESDAHRRRLESAANRARVKAAERVRAYRRGLEEGLSSGDPSKAAESAKKIRVLNYAVLRLILRSVGSRLGYGGGLDLPVVYNAIKAFRSAVNDPMIKTEEGKTANVAPLGSVVERARSVLNESMAMVTAFCALNGVTRGALSAVEKRLGRDATLIDLGDAIVSGNARAEAEADQVIRRISRDLINRSKPESFVRLTHLQDALSKNRKQWSIEDLFFNAAVIRYGYRKTLEEQGITAERNQESEAVQATLDKLDASVEALNRANLEANAAAEELKSAEAEVDRILSAIEKVNAASSDRHAKINASVAAEIRAAVEARDIGRVTSLITSLYQSDQDNAATVDSIASVEQTESRLEERGKYLSDIERKVQSGETITQEELDRAASSSLASALTEYRDAAVAAKDRLSGLDAATKELAEVLLSAKELSGKASPGTFVNQARQDHFRMMLSAAETNDGRPLSDPVASDADPFGYTLLTHDPVRAFNSFTLPKFGSFNLRDQTMFSSGRELYAKVGDLARFIEMLFGVNDTGANRISVLVRDNQAVNASYSESDAKFVVDRDNPTRENIRFKDPSEKVAGLFQMARWASDTKEDELEVVQMYMHYLMAYVMGGDDFVVTGHGGRVSGGGYDAARLKLSVKDFAAEDTEGHKQNPYKILTEDEFVQRFSKEAVSRKLASRGETTTDIWTAWDYFAFGMYRLLPDTLSAVSVTLPGETTGDTYTNRVLRAVYRGAMKVLTSSENGEYTGAGKDGSKNAVFRFREGQVHDQKGLSLKLTESVTDELASAGLLIKSQRRDISGDRLTSLIVPGKVIETIFGNSRARKKLISLGRTEEMLDKESVRRRIAPVLEELVEFRRQHPNLFTGDEGSIAGSGSHFWLSGASGGFGRAAAWHNNHYSTRFKAFIERENKISVAERNRVASYARTIRAAGQASAFRSSGDGRSVTLDRSKSGALSESFIDLYNHLVLRGKAIKDLRQVKNDSDLAKIGLSRTTRIGDLASQIYHAYCLRSLDDSTSDLGSRANPGPLFGLNRGESASSVPSDPFLWIMSYELSGLSSLEDRPGSYGLSISDAFVTEGAIPEGGSVSAGLSAVGLGIANACAYQGTLHNMMVTMNEDGMPNYLVYPSEKPEVGETFSDRFYSELAMWYSSLFRIPGFRYNSGISGRANLRRVVEAIDESFTSGRKGRDRTHSTSQRLGFAQNYVPVLTNQRGSELFQVPGVQNIYCFRRKADTTPLDNESGLDNVIAGGQAIGFLKKVLGLRSVPSDGNQILAKIVYLNDLTKMMAVSFSLFFRIATQYESAIAAGGFVNTMVGQSRAGARALRRRKAGVATDLQTNTGALFTEILRGNGLSGTGNDSSDMLFFADIRDMMNSDDPVLSSLRELCEKVGVTMSYPGENAHPFTDYKNLTEAKIHRFAENAASLISKAVGNKVSQKALQEWTEAVSRGLITDSQERNFTYVMNATKMAITLQILAKLRAQAMINGSYFDPIAELRKYGNYINEEVGGINPLAHAFTTPLMQKILNLLMFSWQWTMGSWSAGGGTVLSNALFGGNAVSKEMRAFYLGRWARMQGWVMFGIPFMMQALITGIVKGVYKVFGIDPDDDDEMKWFTWNNERKGAGYIDITPLLRMLQHADTRISQKLFGMESGLIQRAKLGEFTPFVGSLASIIPMYTGDNTTGARRYYWHFGKQAEEFIRWFRDPLVQASSKLSLPLQTALGQIYGVTVSGFPVQGGPVSNTIGMFLPFSFSGLSTFNEAGGLALAGPVSRGVSQTAVHKELEAALLAYAEKAIPVAGKPWLNRTRAKIADILTDASANGLDPEKALSDAKAGALGVLYRKLNAALPKSRHSTGLNERELLDILRQIRALESTSGRVRTSITKAYKKRKIDIKEYPVYKYIKELVDEALGNDVSIYRDGRSTRSGTYAGRVTGELAVDEIPQTVFGIPVSYEDDEYFLEDPRVAGYYELHENSEPVSLTGPAPRTIFGMRVVTGDKPGYDDRPHREVQYRLPEEIFGLKVVTGGGRSMKDRIRGLREDSFHDNRRHVLPVDDAPSSVFGIPVVYTDEEKEGYDPRSDAERTFLDGEKVPASIFGMPVEQYESYKAV